MIRATPASCRLEGFWTRELLVQTPGSIDGLKRSTLELFAVAATEKRRRKKTRNPRTRSSLKKSTTVAPTLGRVRHWPRQAAAAPRKVSVSMESETARMAVLTQWREHAVLMK